MTINNIESRESVVGSNTVGQVVPVDFAFTNNYDLVVKTREITTGIETSLGETTNYTVLDLGENGSSITMVTAVPATHEIHVVRKTYPTQEVDLTAGGTFEPEVIEGALDKLTLLAAEQYIYLDRMLRVPDTDPTSANTVLPSSIDRAGKYLAFDSSGNPTVTDTVTADTAIVSAYGETLIAAANAAAARTLLALGTAAVLGVSADGTMAGNVDTVMPTQKAVRTYVGANAVAVTGNQNVAGIKTFASSPVVPTPTTDMQAATKKYVDDTAGVLKITGDVVQIVNTQTGAVATGSTVVPYDDTVPQITEGDQYMSLAVTPTSATNVLKIDVVAVFAHSVTYAAVMAALFKTIGGVDTTDALAATFQTMPGDTARFGDIVTLTHYMAAGTTDEITFSLRAGGGEAGTLTFNGVAGARKLGGVCASSITITEYKV